MPDFCKLIKYQVGIHFSKCILFLKTPCSLNQIKLIVFTGSGCGIPEGLISRPNLITSPPVQHATLSKTGEELRFSCRVGFKLFGADKVSCQPAGHWSAIVPECIGKLPFLSIKSINQSINQSEGIYIAPKSTKVVQTCLKLFKGACL